MIENPSLETTTSGSIRFNTDSRRLEIYNGEAWFEIDIDHGSGRGLFMGGTPTPDRIDFITIDSAGDATDFGNLSSGRFTGGAFASSTRAVYAGGELAPGAESNVIDYVTISTTGNAADFGDLTQGSREGTGCSNAIRGMYFSGSGGTDNQIEAITIATLGLSLIHI